MEAVRSMRGKVIDMARLAAENSHQIALGNANMNARGDILGHSGTVIKSREQMTRDYHTTNPKAVRQVALRDINREVFESPAEVVARAQQQAKEAQEAQDARKTKRKITDTDD